MWDSRAVDCINEVYLEMSFKLLTKISDTLTRMLFSMFSYSLLSGDIYYDIFQEVFQRIDNAPNNTVFDNEMVNEEEFSPIVEWLLVSIAKYFAEDDM